MSRRSKATSPILYALAAIAIVAGLAGGHGALPSASDDAQPVATQEQSASSSADGGSASSSDGQAGSGSQAEGGQAATDQQPGTYAWTTWDEQESPNYVRLVGPAYVAGDLQPGEVRYSPLDGLGRAGKVEACVTYQMMEEASERRRPRDLPDPNGWPHNQEVEVQEPDGKVYRGYLWNRSHLLARSLGGSNDLENLVTGTRMQNVGANDGQGGMAMSETAVRDWLSDHHDITAYYAATPVYEGDEMICRSVFVDVRTSDGAINEEVEVYNAAKGWNIDYATGTVTPA